MFERPANRCFVDPDSDLGGISAVSLPKTAHSLLSPIIDFVPGLCFAAREFDGLGAHSDDLDVQREPSVALDRGSGQRSLKTLISILVFLAGLTAQAAVYYADGSNDGSGVQLFADNFNRADSSLGANWTVYNSANITVSGNQMRAVGSGDVTHYAAYKAYPIQNENWSITWDQQTTTETSTSYGVVVGIWGVQPFSGGHTVMAAQVRTTTGSPGTTSLVYGPSLGSSFGPGPAMPYAANDVIHCVLSLNEGVVTFTATNLTEGGSSSSITANCGFLSNSTFTENYLGYVSVWAVGATTLVDNLAVTNTSIVPCDWLVVGASIDVGFSVSNITQRFFNIRGCCEFCCNSLILNGLPSERAER